MIIYTNLMEIINLIKSLDIIAIKKYIIHNIKFINEIIDTNILLEAIKTKNKKILKIILKQIIKHNLIHLIEYTIKHLLNITQIIFLLEVLIKLNFLTKDLLLLIIELENKELILFFIKNNKLNNLIDITTINYLLATENINIIYLFLELNLPYTYKFTKIHLLCDDNTGIQVIKTVLIFYKKNNLDITYLQELLYSNPSCTSISYVS